MALAPELPQPGSILGGKYRVERVLGEGVMGVVYEAVHTRLNQRVAIKAPQPAILTQPVLVDRFEREARAAARLRHRNAVRVIDVDVNENGLPYMVMELLHGHDLESELATRGQFPIDEAVGYVLQACAAMVEAHGRGIVHRDLKPSNLFLNTETDGTVCLKVLDFGVSKIQSENVRITGTQIAMGTPLYMSPEQVRSAKHVDGRADVWSLGVILYEFITGRPPFTGSATGVGAAIVADAPTSLRVHRPEAPAGLEAAVLKAMAKDPAQRFSSMKEMALALVPYAGAHAPHDVLRWSLAQEIDLTPLGLTASTADAVIEVSSAPAATSDVSSPPSGSSKRLKVVAAVLAVALLAVGLIALTSRRAPSPRVDDPSAPSAAATSLPPALPGATAASPSATHAAPANSPEGAPSNHAPAAVTAPLRQHLQAAPTPPKPVVRSTTPAASAKPPEPSKKAWDNDSPLPPQ